MNDSTRILSALGEGDLAATDALLPVVYEELRRLAAAHLANEKPGQTLQPTALAHEAYLRLVGGEAPARWESLGHFFSAAAVAIRRVLVDRARRKSSLKRGGGRARLELDDVSPCLPEPRENLVALDEALTRLAGEDPRAAELVQLRYFGGLTLPEAARALGVSPRGAGRLWAFARSWLRRELEEPGE